ncbi:SPOR domain-containing protein [bacterium]|nr:SPOR domain-containing protein [bacterium]
MSKQDRSNDGFYSKVVIASVVVIWVSLVGGNWLGHYVVEKGLLHDKKKGKSASDEYRPASVQKVKPWITVDPSQQQELERLQGTTHEEEPAPAASATPEAPPVTASPVEMETSAPAPEVTPIAEPTATPGAPTPTPADVQGSTTFHLQFGSFESRENAQALVDNLQAVGQEAEVEEFKGAGGKDLFRVRGGSYTSEEQARQQRDKLSEQQFKAFIVSQ